MARRPTSSCRRAFASLDDEVEWGRRVAGEAGGRPLGRHPLAGGVRRPRRVAGAGRDLQHGVRPVAGAAAGQPGRHQPRRPDAARARHRRAEAAVAAVDPRPPSEIWCQLFSEPDAGSRPRVARDDARDAGRRRLAAQRAEGVDVATRSSPRWGICLARTDPDAPKHAGISYLVVDMQAPGIEIRPLVQITGEAEFNEVFLDEVFVPDDHLVGGARQGLGASRTRRWPTSGARTSRSRSRSCTRCTSTSCTQLAAERGRARRRRGRRRAGPGVRRAAGAAAAQLAHALAPRPGHRARARVELGEAGVDRHDPAPRRTPRSTWSATPRRCGGAADNPGGGRWQRQWLWSKAASIAGGTSEVQRTIIGERILGLPREGA